TDRDGILSNPPLDAGRGRAGCRMGIQRTTGGAFPQVVPAAELLLSDELRVASRIPPICFRHAAGYLGPRDPVIAGSVAVPDRGHAGIVREWAAADGRPWA